MDILEKIEEFENFDLFNWVDDIVLFAHFLFWFLILLVFLSICCYVIKSLALFNLSKKAGAKSPILSFIPILQNAKIFNLAGFTDIAFYGVLVILFLAYCIPSKLIALLIGIVHLALTIYMRCRVAKNFGGGIGKQILTCLFEPIMLIYFALTNKVYTSTPIYKKIYETLDKCNLTDFVLDEQIKNSKTNNSINVEINDKK